MDKYNYLPNELLTRVNLQFMVNADAIAAEIVRLDEARTKHEAAKVELVQASEDAQTKLAAVDNAYAEVSQKASDADKTMAAAQELASKAQAIVDREAEVTKREADVAYREQAYNVTKATLLNSFK